MPRVAIGTHSDSSRQRVVFNATADTHTLSDPDQLRVVDRSWTPGGGCTDNGTDSLSGGSRESRPFSDCYTSPPLLHRYHRPPLRSFTNLRVGKNMSTTPRSISDNRNMEGFLRLDRVNRLLAWVRVDYVEIGRVGSDDRNQHHTDTHTFAAHGGSNMTVRDRN
jgi:hypothetical protein